MAKAPDRYRVGRMSVALTAGVVLGLTACGGDAGSSTAAPEQTSAPPSAATVPAEQPSPPPADVPEDPCPLLTKAELERVFDGDVPVPTPMFWGPGYAECDWEKGDAHVRLSLVPLEDLKADYIDQLNQHGTVPALGPEAVAIIGLAGIGFASGGGVTVAFPTDGTGVLVAVRTTEDQTPAAALPFAVDLGKAVAGRLG